MCVGGGGRGKRASAFRHLVQGFTTSKCGSLHGPSCPAPCYCQVSYEDGEAESLYLAAESVRLLVHAGEVLTPPAPQDLGRMATGMDASAAQLQQKLRRLAAGGARGKGANQGTTQGTTQGATQGTTQGATQGTKQGAVCKAGGTQDMGDARGIKRSLGGGGALKKEGGVVEDGEGGGEVEEESEEEELEKEVGRLRATAAELRAAALVYAQQQQQQQPAEAAEAGGGGEGEEEAEERVRLAAGEVVWAQVGGGPWRGGEGGMGHA